MAITRREPASSRRKSVREKDATVAYVGAITKESIEIAEKIAAYIVAHPRCLSVPDVATEKEFLQKAKQIYREAHSLNRKRGRRTEESCAIDNLITLSNELGRKLTQGEMIKSLMKLNLSKNTAGKYAKLYHLSTQDAARFSQSDQRWLCKEFGSESLSPAWWMDRHWQWWEGKAERTGLLAEIRNLFLNL